ncbi:ATP-binding protein [Inquilinus sp. CAU 1745]|uniref:sensor histidine kinase n=1 Tax=Inquilinus sp. CAU 1745 TaxID=3140369 RepID=UPI00325A552A
MFLARRRRWSLFSIIFPIVSVLMTSGFLITALLGALGEEGIWGVQERGLAEQGRVIAENLTLDADGRPQLDMAEIRRRLPLTSDGDIYGFALLRPDGTVAIGGSAPYAPLPAPEKMLDPTEQSFGLPLWDDEEFDADGLYFYAWTDPENGDPVTSVNVLVEVQGSRFIIQLTAPRIADRRILLDFLVITFGEAFIPMLIPLGLVLASVWLTLYLSLNPLRKISARAALIGPATLHERLPTLALAEVAPLIDSFNIALDRLESAWSAQKAFAANAAHELRTPLAVVRAQLGDFLSGRQLEEIEEEFDRLNRLIAQLLALAQVEAGTEDKGKAFDLVGLVREVTADMAPAIVGGGRSIALEIETDSLPVTGDRHFFEIAFRNVLENATRHTPTGASITVRVMARGGVRVSDDGPGIPQRLRQRLFSRFAKADPKGPGVGLGLALALAAVRASGGDLRLAPGDAGATFEFQMPVQQA